MKRKHISLILACSMALNFMPQVSTLANATTDKTVVFSNDFESSNLPDEIGGILTSKDVSIEKAGGSKALKISSKFDGTDDWDNNKHEIAFNTESTDLPEGTKIEYDILIPSSNKFTGIMKSAGGFSIYDGSEWGWASLDCGDIKYSDFEDLGNGYSKVHVATPLNEEVKGVRKLDIQIDSYLCTYEGYMYLDNIQIVKPKSQASTATNDKTIFFSDFEANQKPSRVDGVLTSKSIGIKKVNDSNALKVNVKFDGTDDWDNNKHEMIFDVKSDDAVTTAAKLEFDLLIPTANKGFDGLFKVAGGFSTFDGDNWGWVNNSGTEMKSSDFKDLGNGYSIKHVVLNPSDTIEGLQNINIQLESYMCDYKGEAYIDNLRFHETKAGEEVEAPTTGLMWDFNDAAKGLDGWKYDSVYAYDGPHDVSYDKDFTGSGSLKLDVKYNPTDSWSEVKIDKWINEGVNLGEYNTIKFNLYYNPANMTKGTFKSQFWANSDVNKSADIDLTKAEYLGNGISKVPVSITYTPKDIKTNILILSVVGSNTDYEGALYIDDINLTKKEVKDPYVKVSATPTKNPTKVDISSLDIENSVQLADSESTKETASLFAYLKALGKTKYALFGHQNPSTYKAGPKDSGNDSDVEDLTGTLPGVCGIDALCFTGSELQAKPGTDLVTATADVCKAQAKKGSIITLSAHMPNFALVAEKPKKNGQYDYSGYTVNDLSGNTAQRILPGGDLNEVYNGYLDMIADYGKQMEQAGIPVLFRPFHECTGNWFWWGTAACDDDTYKSLFDYTVEYLRDTKGVHNFLYVYSTSGGFNSKDELMSRYPGDAFTDVIAFDQYHNNPKGGPDEDQWFQNLKDCVKMCDEAAAEHGKISTLSETGIATTKGKLYEQDGATAVSGNRDKDWYQHVAEIVSESDMPYFLVWANFAKDNFYVPYMVDGERGHEMVDNFINYYNEENSVFANGVGDYRSFDVNVEGALDYGYIESPASGSRILEPTTIKAKVSSKSSDVKYVVKVKDEVIDTLNAKLNEVSGLYEAEISQDLLDKIGGKVGKIELTIDDKAVASGKYIFNIPEPVEKNELVDDFESYGDENELLQGVWKTNAGTGCTITPELGKFGKNHYLKFKYNINTSALDEGYAGIIKAKKCDWSAYDAVEISINPDGYGQKLVIQITSNGEDFEVHLPEFAATTEAKTLRIPFSQFKGKQNGKFDPSNITSFGLWCNTIVPEGHEGVWTVDSEFGFDNFHACNMSDAKPEEDAVKEATLAVEKAETSKASSDIEVAEKLVKALNESAEKTALQARITKLKASLNPSTQDTVVIEDMNLKLAILNELKKPVTAEITKADMLKLKNFDVKNKNIKSLSGLEYAKNLRMLDLTGNNVSDISNIKGLKGLKYLTLFGNDISDESAEDLASMTQLLSLNLDHTKISNIDFVKGMANLRNLYVSYTDVADLTPVIGLTHLKILYFNYTKVTSLKFLYDCRSINVIGYTGCDCQPDSGMFWQLKNIQVK